MFHGQIIFAADGNTAPPKMQGRDMSPLYLAAKKPEWRTEFFYASTQLKFRSVSTPGAGGVLIDAVDVVTN